MRFYIGNTGHIKKSWKFQNFILVPGVRKTDFYDFSGIFLRKNGPGIWESRVRRPGNLEWDDPGIFCVYPQEPFASTRKNLLRLPARNFCVYPQETLRWPTRNSASQGPGTPLLQGSLVILEESHMLLHKRLKILGKPMHGFPSHSRFPDSRPIFS